MIVSYRDLKVWQLGMDLVEQVYFATRDFPSEERYGLTSQARRAAVSIPANIAEGRARTHLGVYLNHLAVAQGSLAELETHLDLARRLGFLTEDVTTQLFLVTGKLGRMLHTLVRRLREGTRTPRAIGSTRRLRTHSGTQSQLPDTRDPPPAFRPS
jgi:four helix bundle protein